jgi:starch phosphorylase
VPVFNTNRMVRQYAEEFYIPAYDRGQMLGSDSLARAVKLAHSKDSLRGRWSNIKVVGVHTTGNGHYKIGDTVQVEALVDLPEIEPTDLKVQLYAGAINATGAIDNPQILTMEHTRQMGPGRHLFTGRIQCRTSGRQGFARRILPRYQDLASPFEPGLIIWN